MHRSKKHKPIRFTILSGIFCCCAAFALFSCKSVPRGLVSDPFAVLEPDSSLFIRIPAVTGYQKLIQDMIVAENPSLEPENVQKIAGHVTLLYAGIGDAESSNRIQTVIAGSVPAFAPAVLSSKKEWRKVSLHFETGHTGRYEYYTGSNSPYEIAFADREIVLLADDVRPLLERYDRIVSGLQNPSVKNSLLTDNIILWMTADVPQIRFCILRPQAFLAELLGMDMRFALKDVKGELVPSGENDLFDLKLYLTFQNRTVVTAAAALLKLSGLRNVSITESPDTAEMRLGNIQITEQQLMKLLPEN
ncbi:MAG: hypothetical protein LKF96_00310 [Treponema sp.]|nr:hypothetical protein [Treponema sp.]